MACDAGANAAGAPDAPPAADEDKDNDVNLPNGEEDDEVCALDNIDACISTDMIAMYIRVLGFKEGAPTTLYDD